MRYNNTQLGSLPPRARVQSRPPTSLEIAPGVTSMGLRQDNLPGRGGSTVLSLSHRRLGKAAAGDEGSLSHC
jgi:hypothetical protein